MLAKVTTAVRFGRDSGTMIARLPASAVVSADGVPSVWVLDPKTHRAVAHRVQVSAWLGDGEVAITGGVEAGRGDCDRRGGAIGCHHAGCRLGRSDPMNLSAWALRHRALTLY